ncbi:MAG TPA: cadherin-like domain-containing protein [Candidatus Binatia bacterium]|nr:cadherin-like domain-containing protein [Candidatus Binatia bacterium]
MYTSFSVAAVLGSFLLTAVAAANVPPTSSNSSVTTNEDNAVIFNFNANDPDGQNSNLIFHIVSGPSSGVLVQKGTAPSRHEYTPNLNYNGADSVTFYVTDAGGAASGTATVTLTINAVNDRAVAIPATFSLVNGQTVLQGQLQGTDVESDPATLDFFSFADPSHGTVTIVKDTGAFTYTASNSTYRGSDSFQFKVKDDGAFRSDPATVTLWLTEDTATLFGAADTFGTYGLTINSGQYLLQSPVENWQFDPGTTAYFAAVADDGTVFTANYTQTYNAFLIANCSMVVSCFNPSSPTCYDAETQQAEHVSHIRIPNANDELFTPDVATTPCSDLDPFDALGADVSDVVFMPDAQAGDAVVFVSTIGSISSNGDAYPAFGKLHKTNGSWSLDEASLRWAEDLQDSEFDNTGANVACLGGTGVDCGGFSEAERLPRSGNIIVGGYTGQRLVVLSPAGEVVAAYEIPLYGDTPCESTASMVLSPRAIQVDPTSAVDDERFAVVYDSSAVDAQYVQEFRYVEATQELSPVSVAFAPYSASSAASLSCSAGVRGSEPMYDETGNLWLATMVSATDSKMHVFTKDAVTGLRRTETDCSYTDPATSLPRQFGSRCRSDFDLGLTHYASPKLAWSVPLAATLTEDTAADSFFGLDLFDGRLFRIERVSSSNPHIFSVSANSLDLGINRLDDIFINRGAFDPAAGALWATAGVRRPVSNCTFFDCVWEVGQSSDNYLFRLDVDEATAAWPKALSASAATSVTAGNPVTVSVVSNVISNLDATLSGLYVYGDPTVDTAQRIALSVSGAGATRTYSATIPGSSLSGMSPNAIWRMFIKQSGVTRGTVVVGRIKVN